MNVSPRAVAAVLALSVLVQFPLHAAAPPPAPEPGRGADARFLPANYELTIAVERPGDHSENRMVVAHPQFSGSSGGLQLNGELVPLADGAIGLDYNLALIQQEPNRAPREVGHWRSATRFTAGQPVEVIRSGDTLVRISVRPLG